MKLSLFILFSSIFYNVQSQGWKYYEEEGFDGIYKMAYVYDNSDEFIFVVNNQICGGYFGCGAIILDNSYPELSKSSAIFAMQIWVRFKGNPQKHLLRCFKTNESQGLTSFSFYYVNPDKDALYFAVNGINPNTDFFKLLKFYSEMYVRIEFDSSYYKSEIEFKDLTFNLKNSTNAIEEVFAE